MDEDLIETPEENEKPEDPEIKEGTSILNTTKKLLGINPEFKEFDKDLVVHINNAIFTLSQLGLDVPKDFFVMDETKTYEDLLVNDPINQGPVSLYIFYKTRAGFDPPSNSYVLDDINKSTQELEWRIRLEIEDLAKEGGDIQNDNKF